MPSSSSSAIAPDIKVRTKRRQKAHPHPYLYGNFYPVFEETVGDEGIECEVIGTIPESLRGSQYVRTGPNSLNVPKEAEGHHWFDGEGMLHGVYFEPGEKGQRIRPRYMNRWVRSDVFKKANNHGPMVLSLGYLMAKGSVLYLFWQMFYFYLKAKWFGLKSIANGNTALTWFGSRLLALQEAGRPLETKVPSLDTVGEYYFEEEGSTRVEPKSHAREAVTAHPKVDPKTGEIIFFAWLTTAPFMQYSVVSAEGKRKVWEQPIPGYTKATMTHDFAITETHSILFNLPYTIDGSKHSKEGKPIFAFDPTVPSKFGIIPRYFDASKDEVRWFESLSCHIFHTANAWDERDAEGNIVAVCMTACRSARFVANVNQWQPTTANAFGGGKTAEEYETEYATPGSGLYDQQDPDGTYLTLFRFDFKTGKTQLTTLSTVMTEFPMINFDRYTQPDLKFAYGATVAAWAPREGLKFDGILKTNFGAVIEQRNKLVAQNKRVGQTEEGRWEIGGQELKELERTISRVHKFGPHTYGSEPLFIANNSNDSKAAEDDGHLLVYVYDERQMEEGLAKEGKPQVTELWIFDAKTIGQEYEPVAKVKIPRRVPYGFHGLWVSKEQIQQNKELNRQRAL
ncbi:hypothetical protein BGZ83_002138 [Gryganskiella cystojenkinii]|nr:hypothetical protein BGZ83_002138 [Gryganskiella cystojenkinii]